LVALLLILDSVKLVLLELFLILRKDHELFPLLEDRNKFEILASREHVLKVA